MENTLSPARHPWMVMKDGVFMGQRFTNAPAAAASAEMVKGQIYHPRYGTIRDFSALKRILPQGGVGWINAQAWKDKWVEVSEVYQSWLDGFGGQNVSMKYYYAITDRRVL